jgi:hypothetical protein
VPQVRLLRNGENVGASRKERTRNVDLGGGDVDVEGERELVRRVVIEKMVVWQGWQCSLFFSFCSLQGEKC